MNLIEWIDFVTSIRKKHLLDNLQKNEFDNLMHSCYSNFLSDNFLEDSTENFLWDSKIINLLQEKNSSPDQRDDQLNTESEVELELDDKTRIEFKGQVDQKGHFIYGRLTQYNLKSGLEELALEGSFENGRLNGKIRESEYERWYGEAYVNQGERHGFFRRFTWDTKFLELGCYIHNQKVTNLGLCQKEGQSFTMLIPTNDETEVTTTTGLNINSIYMYPGLQYGYINDVFGLIRNDEECMATFGFPVVKFDIVKSEPKIWFDPSTTNRISKYPLQENAFEKIHVYVAPSTISPLAGEGLFARKTLKKGQLISLFNGIRWRKEGRRPKAIQAGSEDWSDYRLTLDRYTDLDIPDDYVNLDQYCATLGHKACHTFGKRKNARFECLWHPRFGSIMSVVALKSILADEEILVSYNYDLRYAPEWYLSLWQEHMQTSK